MRSSVASKSGRKLEGLSSYFREIGKYPPLTREEEHVLAVRARRGDPTARQQLARHNLALVISVARKQRRGTVPLDDIVQEGNVGLMRAVEKFDPHAGTRFCTYAIWWIRAYVGRYLKEARSTVRPRSGEVAVPDISLDAPIRQDSDVTHLELLEADGVGAEGSYLSAESDRAVRDALARVRKRIGELGWEIVRDRLQQDPATTLAEIGKRWGVSRERVRQVEVRTKQLLNRYLELEREAA